MDVQDGLEKSIIDQLVSVGAVASMGASKFESRTIFSENVAPENIVSITNVSSPQNREETLSLLYEVGKIAEKYIIEYVNPLVEQLEKVENELEELNNSGKIEWAKDIVGENLFYSVCIGDLYDLVKGQIILKKH